jgi:hypothetical protein
MFTMIQGRESIYALVSRLALEIWLRGSDNKATQGKPHSSKACDFYTARWTVYFKRLLGEVCDAAPDQRPSILSSLATD